MMNKGLHNPIDIKTVFLLLSYYLIVVIPHEVVGKLIATIFSSVDRDRYNLIILIFFSILTTIAGLFLMRKIKPVDRKLIFGYILITLILIVLSFKVLFVFNVEAIHFVQYAIFAIICFSLNRSYFQTMIWACLAGAMDELFQYVYLAPQRTDYYDFNDVIINTIGAGVGLLFIRVMNRTNRHFSWLRFKKSLTFKVLIGIIIIIMVGVISGYISNLPNKDAIFVLQKKVDIEFWHTVYLPKYIFYVKFHVVKPLEGLIITVFIIIFYSFLQIGTKNEEITVED